MSDIINPSTEAGERLEAVRKYARLSITKPAEAAPLTDEDLDIFERQAQRCGHQFMWFAKASYLEYFVFFGGEMGKAMDWCRERL